MLKTFSVNVLLSDDASVAEATGALHPYAVGEVRGKGAAKRHPKDSPDETVGYSLAVARALRDLADQYEKRAEEAQNYPPQRVVYGMDPAAPGGLVTYTTPNPSIFSVNQEV